MNKIKKAIKESEEGFNDIIMEVAKNGTYGNIKKATSHLHQSQIKLLESIKDEFKIEGIESGYKYIKTLLQESIKDK